MTNAFEAVIEKLSARSEIERIAKSQAAGMASELPEIPAEYFDFLTRAGFGHLGDLQFYDGPVPIGDIYPQHSATKSIVLICDDMQGYCYGFDLEHNCTLVEISPKGLVSSAARGSFPGLIMSYFGSPAS